jgi:hypothetical protein
MEADGRTLVGEDDGLPVVLTHCETAAASGLPEERRLRRMHQRVRWSKERKAAKFVAMGWNAGTEGCQRGVGGDEGGDNEVVGGVRRDTLDIVRVLDG